MPQAALERQGLPCPCLAHHQPESLNIITVAVVVVTHLLMWHRVQAGYTVEAGRREGHRPQDLPAALCAGPAAEGQPCHALPAPPARQRQACCQPAGLTCFDLTLIGLLYKAYPDGCQQVLLRLRPVFCAPKGSRNTLHTLSTTNFLRHSADHFSVSTVQ